MKSKIVLIGAGKFGSNHLRTLTTLHDRGKIDLIGVVDADKKILQNVRKKYSVSTSMNYKQFLTEANSFDIVTPAFTHHNLAKKLLNSSKNVFVEKPLSLNFKNANELVKLAKKRKKILQVGHIFRYNPAVNNLKKLLKKEKNLPFYINGKFLQNTSPKTDLGAIFNFIHHFDILDNLLEITPHKIFAVPNLIDKKIKKEINVDIFLQYSKNINSFLSLGWIPVGKYRTIELFFKNKQIICDLQNQEIQILYDEKPSKKIKQKFQEPLLLELEDFSKCVKNNQNPLSNGTIGARIVKIAETATRSMNESKPILLR